MKLLKKKKKKLAYLPTLKHIGTFPETRHLLFWPNAYLALERSLNPSSPYFRKNNAESMWNLPIPNKGPPFSLFQAPGALITASRVVS